MTKKYLSVAFAYVGVIVGAGLASGQDLLQYFLSFGAKGLIGIVALGVLNVIFGVVALQLDLLCLHYGLRDVGGSWSEPPAAIRSAHMGGQLTVCLACHSHGIPGF